MDDELENRIYRETTCGRNKTEAKRARPFAAAAAAICILCLMTTAAFAVGIPQSIFAYLKNRHASHQGEDFIKMDELAGQGIVATEGFSIDQAYYDGQQLAVGISYDNTKLRICDGVYLTNGDKLMRDAEDGDVNADGTGWLYIKLATPLPESAQNQDSLEVVSTPATRCR